MTQKAVRMSFKGRRPFKVEEQKQWRNIELKIMRQA